jgi:hypothetical protein
MEAEKKAKAVIVISAWTSYHPITCRTSVVNATNLDNLSTEIVVIRVTSFIKTKLTCFLPV